MDKLEDKRPPEPQEYLRSDTSTNILNSTVPFEYKLNDTILS